MGHTISHGYFATSLACLYFTRPIEDGHANIRQRARRKGNVAVTESIGRRTVHCLASLAKGMYTDLP